MDAVRFDAVSRGKSRQVWQGEVRCVKAGEAGFGVSESGESRQVWYVAVRWGLFGFGLLWQVKYVVVRWGLFGFGLLWQVGLGTVRSGKMR